MNEVNASEQNRKQNYIYCESMGFNETAEELSKCQFTFGWLKSKK